MLIFTDLKTAVRQALECYRLELTGAETVSDPKQLAKVPKLANVRGLKLVTNNLSEIPAPFLSLSGLVYFYSYGNPLRTLSDSIGMLDQLRFLELYGTAFDTLPRGLAGLTRLQSLVIASNRDTLVFPDTSALPTSSLTELRIYRSVLDTLPESFATQPKLQKLVLFKCGLRELPAPVRHLPALKELWLDSNSITTLPREISEMQSLTHLSLRGNRLTHIPGTICFLTNLAVLDLRGNPIDPYEVKCLQALLPTCKILF